MVHISLRWNRNDHGNNRSFRCSHVMCLNARCWGAVYSYVACSFACRHDNMFVSVSYVLAVFACAFAVCAAVDARQNY